ncbi:hypothetical protein [Thermonema rossianum]|uniref:hypothetical protein n=1 Tax=Thermonema rossianum TaxID=55505 RepID=UPI00057062AB|nr:hypothetical protein [Thermonema rossianum]
MKTLKKLLLLCFLCVIAQHTQAQRFSLRDNQQKTGDTLYLRLTGKKNGISFSDKIQRIWHLREPGEMGDSLFIYYQVSIVIYKNKPDIPHAQFHALFTPIDIRIINRRKMPSHKEVPLQYLQGLQILSPDEFHELIVPLRKRELSYGCTVYHYLKNKTVYVVEELPDKAYLWLVVPTYPADCIKF